MSQGGSGIEHRTDYSQVCKMAQRQRISLNSPDPPQPRIRGQFAPRKPVPAPPQTRGNNDVVTVACSYPPGITLHLSESYEVQEPTNAGYRTITAHRRIPEQQITINGPGPAWNMDPDRKRNPPPEYPILSNYALTTNVPLEFWEEWLRQGGKDSNLVQNNLLLAYKSENDTKAAAREREKELTGLEQIDPDNPTSKSRELSNMHGRVKIGRGDKL
jgi:hypothetical protein